MGTVAIRVQHRFWRDLLPYVIVAMKRSRLLGSLWAVGGISDRSKSMGFELVQNRVGPLDSIGCVRWSSFFENLARSCRKVEAYKTPKKRRSLGGEDEKMKPPVRDMKNTIRYEHQEWKLCSDQ